MTLRAKPTRWLTAYRLALVYVRFIRVKMICAALQAPQPPARKSSANQAQINAQIIFPRTSVTSEMARKPFCQLRKPFCPGAQTILPDAQVILLGSANHFDEDHVSWDLPAGQPPWGHLARQLTASRLI